MKGQVSETLEHRVEKLEKAGARLEEIVREMKYSGVVVLNPDGGPRRTVEAEEFHLLDVDGKARTFA